MAKLLRQLAVMTFNLRRSSRADGRNHWAFRKQLVAEAIRSAQAEIIGTQEGLPEMLEELDALLPEFARIGEGRRGGSNDEHCAIYYAKDRWRPAGHGTFWLSAAPEKTGSRGWFAVYPRICTWAAFEAADGSSARLAVYNVHLDHISCLARERGAALAAARLLQRRGQTGGPALLMGDFNAPPSSRAVSQLTAPTYGLADVYGTFPGGVSAIGATYHGFRGGGAGGRPIDYVFATSDIQIEQVKVDRSQYEGRYPSDHYPLTVRIAIP